MIRKPEMFKEAECGRGSKLIIQILIFFAVFMVSSMLQSMLPTFLMIGDMLKEFSKVDMNNFDEASFQAIVENVMAIQNRRPYLLLTLFVTIFGIVTPIIYCKCIEKRPLTSMGFKKKNAVRDYLIGLVLGFAMFSAVILINVITGAMTVEGLNNSFSTMNIVFIVLFFIGFVIQGASEEIMVRGYFMTSLGAKHNMWLALLISSGMFGLLHVGNPGFTFLGFVNIILVGVMFGMYIICFDNIWGACALHTMWNFVQGNFYGVQVSGLTMSDSVLTTTINEEMKLINGGSFGAEGGIATTIVQLLCIGGLLLYMKFTGKFIKKNTEE